MTVCVKVKRFCELQRFASAGVRFRRRPLRFERLEDRCLLTITVDTLTDEFDGSVTDGDVSLRDAIAAAAAGEAINFAPELVSGGPATLTLTQGELLINKALTINGLGADLLTIDASGNDPTPNLNNGDGSRIFNIDADVFPLAEVTISGLTITGGDSPQHGGAILSRESLTIVASQISENAGLRDLTAIRPRGGGAIDMEGFLTLVDSEISGNTTTHSAGGGAIYARGGVSVLRSLITGNNATECAEGGGLVVIGGLNITESVISHNELLYSGTSESFVHGGGVWASELTMTDSFVINNSAVNKSSVTPSAHGGGIYVAGFSPTTIQRSAILGNFATSNGGGIHATQITRIEETVIADNSSEGIGGGLAIFASNTEVTLDRVTISRNSTNLMGGGLWIFLSGGASATIEESTVLDNHADGDGGGIASFAGYSGSVGGFTISNSTISGNSAGKHGGGVWTYTEQASTTRIAHSTITGNTADSDGNEVGSGGGIYVASYGTPGPLGIENTIIARNLDQTTLSPDLRDMLGGIVGIAYTLIGDNSGSGLVESPAGSQDANGNRIGGTINGVIDPLIGPLVYNGGPDFLDGSRMLTHALLPGSPAIDAGDPTAMPGIGGVPLHDQRGLPWQRVADGDVQETFVIDIGAIERQINPLFGDYNFNGVVDTADYTVWRDLFGSLTDLRADGDGNGVVDQDDYNLWRTNFGNVFSAASAASESLPNQPQPPRTAGAIQFGNIGSTTFDLASRTAPPTVRRLDDPEVVSAFESNDLLIASLSFGAAERLEDAPAETLPAGLNASTAETELLFTPFDEAFALIGRHF